MRCNLLLLEEQLRRPWTWIPKHASNSIHKLYHSALPVPGIYAISASGHHYLVAIKPARGVKDTENLFEPAKASWNTDDIKPTSSRLQAKKSTTSGECHPELQKLYQHEKASHLADFVLNGTGGKCPHQKSPFRNHLFNNDGHCSLSSLFGNSWKCSLQEADINGYKKLRKALRIEFCKANQRMMFSSEIKIRTEKMPMCRDMACTRRSHEKCGKEVWRKMFCLDDGYSWVVVGRNGRAKEGMLFKLDEETDCIRRLSEEEARVSEFCLERERGQFLDDGEEGEHMPLIRYWDIRGVEKIEGETLDLGRARREVPVRRSSFAEEWLERQKLVEKKFEEGWFTKERLAKWILDNEEFLKERVEAERFEREWVESLRTVVPKLQSGWPMHETAQEGRILEERLGNRAQAGDLGRRGLEVKA